MRFAAFCSLSATSATMRGIAIKRKYPTNSIICARPTKSSPLLQEQLVFVEAFKHAYIGLPNNELHLPGTKTLDTFLEEAFVEELSSFQNTDEHDVRFYSASLHEEEKDNEEIAGYLSVDVSSSDKGVEIYMRQLAVKPKFQRRGIGQALIRFVIADVDDVKRITVSCRKTNEPAQNLYKSLGFVDDESCHPSLDPVLYTGMKWERPIQDV